jgi:hypothetical protein
MSDALLPSLKFVPSRKSKGRERRRYLSKPLREHLMQIVERVRLGIPEDESAGKVTRDITKSVSKFERRLAVDFLLEEGLTRTRIAQVLGFDRKTIYEDLKWIAELRRRELGHGMIVDLWLKGVRAMESSIESAAQVELEADEPGTRLFAIRAKMQAGKDLAAESRALATSAQMLSLLREVGTKDGDDKVPSPLDPRAFLEYVYQNRVLRPQPEARPSSPGDIILDMIAEDDDAEETGT